MKRKRSTQRVNGVNKRQKVDIGTKDPPAWPLLRQYYPQVVTLRQYLASRLAKGSKKRKRELLRYEEAGDDSKQYDSEVSSLLDNTAVGTFNHVESACSQDLDHDITIFTQQVGSTSSTSPTQGALKQSEVGWISIFTFDRSEIPHSCGSTKPKYSS